MSFKISLRPIQLSDIGQECPFFPEDGEYERHLTAIAQDIESIDGVESASASDTGQIAVTAPGMSLDAFKVALKPLLQHHFAYLRYDGIEQVAIGCERAN